MTIATTGASQPPDDDVVELILADHREFERLLRELRNRETDRPAVLAQLADLLVAHAEAEEREVYPSLRRRAPAEEEDEIEHGYEEHADGHQALLDLLEADPGDEDAFEQALEELSETVTHHLDEEERDILNSAREHVSVEERSRLGRAFRDRRGVLLEDRPGAPDNVARLVSEARDAGLLEDRAAGGS